MKKMAKIKDVFLGVFMCLAMLFFGVGLSACENKYDRLSITLSQSEIVLEISDGVSNAQTVIAEVVGANSISRELNVFTEASQLSVTTEMNDQQQTVITVSASAVCTRAEVVVKTLEGGKTASFLVSVIEPVKMINLSQSLDNLFVVKGQALNLNNASLVEFSPQTTTQKNLEFSIVGNLENISLENGVLFVNKEYQQESVKIKITSPHLSGTELILDLVVLPSLNSETVSFASIEYQSGLLEPIFTAGQEMPKEIVMSGNLASKQSVVFELVVKSSQPVSATPMVLSTLGQSSQLLNFASSQKTQVLSGGKLSETHFSFVLTCENLSGYDSVFFEVKFDDYDYTYSTSHLKVLVKDSVSKLELYADGVLSNQSIFTVYDVYKNRKGLALSFNALPTTLSQEEKTLVLELGVNAEAYKFWTENGEDPIEFTENQFEFIAGETIYVSATEYDALNGQIKVFAKENPVVSHTLTLQAGAGTTSMEFINSAEKIELPNDQGFEYFYNISSNQEMQQIIKFKTDANDISALNLEISGDMVKAVSMPLPNGNHFEFTIQSVLNKQGTAVITLRQANGYYVQAFVRVIYELKAENLSFSVPSAQVNANVAFMETSTSGAWEFRVALTFGSSITLSRSTMGVESVLYEFSDALKDETTAIVYENFFDDNQARPQNLTYSQVSSVLDAKLLSLNELKPKAVGKTWVKVTSSGFVLQEMQKEGTAVRTLSETYEENYFLVEGFIPAQNFGLSTYDLRLYSQESIGFVDMANSTADVVLTLNNSTYQNISWQGVSEVFSVGGKEVYRTSLSPDNKTLSITAISTWEMVADEPVLQSSVQFVFIAVIKEFNTEYRLPVNLEIVKAQQVEKILVENVNTAEGIYIPLYHNGKDVTRQIIATSQVGESGKVPFNNSLVFEFLPYLSMPTDGITVDFETGLITVKSDATTGTVGLIRVAPADRYDQFNKYRTEPNDVAIYIELVVADGQTRETAYRISSLGGFTEFSNNLETASHQHFVLVNDITIDPGLDQEYAIFDKFYGGLYGGPRGDVIHQIITTKPLFNTVETGAVVQDLMLSGEVVGASFVAGENKGKIINAQVVSQNNSQSFKASKLTVKQDNAYAGALVGVNSGEILNSTVSLQIVGENLSVLNSVGGITGTSTGKIDGCVVEFCEYAENFTPNANKTHDIFSVGDATLGGLVGVLTGGTLTNSYVQSYVSIGTAQSLLVTNGTYGALVGQVLGGNVNICFASVQNHQNIYGTIAKEHEFVENAYVTYKQADDAEVFAKYISNFITVTYSGNPEVLVAIPNNDVWDKTTSLPTFKTLKPKSAVENISATFNQSQNVFSDVLNGQSVALMFIYQVEDMLTAQEKTALNNLNFYAFSDLFSGNLYGLMAYSSNPAVVEVSASGIKLTGEGVAEVTFFSKYNHSIQKTFTLCVIPPIHAPVFDTGTRVFGNNDILNVKATSGFSFVLKTNNLLVLDERALTITLADYDLEFSSPVIVGNNPYSVSTSTLGIAKTTIEYSLKNFNTQFDEIIDSLTKTVFSGKFTLNVYNGADKIELSRSNLTFEPYDKASFGVTLYTDTALSNGEALVVLLSQFGAYPQNLFEIVSECVSVKYYLDADLTPATEQTAKYYVYNFNVQLSVREEYCSLDFIGSNFVFTVTSQSSLDAQSQFGANLVYETLEVAINTQKILSISANHYEKTNKAVLKDAEANKNFVFYQYNLSQSNNILSPGEEGLLKIDIYPTYSRYDHLDLTFTANTENVAIQFMLMEKYLDSASGLEGFRQKTNGYENIENGIRIYNTPSQSQTVTTLYIGTYLPIATNKDAVFQLSLTSSNGLVQTLETTFNIVVEYIDDAVISVVSDMGEQLQAVACGASANLLITLPKDPSLTLEHINVLGVLGMQATPETSISIGRVQVIEDSLSLTRTYKYIISVGSDVQIDQNANYVTIEAVMSWLVGGKMQKKVSTYTLGIVDFVIEEISLKADADESSVFHTYIGVDSVLSFNFKTQPTVSSKFEDFLNRKYYEALSQVNQTGAYIVNYGKQEYQSFLSNLYYVNGSYTYPLMNTDLSLEPNNYFTFSEENGQIKIQGTRQGEVQLRFIMTVQYPHPSVQTLHEISFDFTVEVQPFSDENLPLIIDNEKAFYDALNQTNAQDYILMANLTLSNYSPYNTQSIASLDGNGYVINIASWAKEENTTTVNRALFNQVAESTTLKNLTVNLCASQEEIDVNVINQVNIAGLAITNNGIIYNCGVVTSPALSGQSKASTGINVQYSKQYIGQTTQSTISGFVQTNNGYITNSRVGGEFFETALSTRQPLEVFEISGQGNISGFVDTNNGTIASSFFANGSLSNNSVGSLETITSGFVRQNNGTITTSYAKGTGEKAFSLTGKGITTSSISAGFVGINSGKISDSYANIFLASTAQSGEYQTGRLSAGFVYNNMGKISSCFTASKIQNAKTTQMAFVGVDESGNLLNSGSIKYSYYYNDNELEGDAYSDETSNLNVVRVAEPNNPENFYGFAFSDSASSVNGVWYASSYGIDLVSANQIAISNRYVANQKIDAETGELISYNLPYADGYDYGSVKNPIIIRSAEEFNRVFGGDDLNAGTAISKYYSLSQQKVYGHYRLISNINLGDLNPDVAETNLMSTKMSLSGAVLDGNMLTISGIDITAQSDGIIASYGLFKSLENGACIKNLNLEVLAVSAKQARFVGVLAGYVQSSKVVSVTVNGQSTNQDSIVLGNNVVGGLVGVVQGDSQIKNAQVSNLSLKTNALATGASNMYQRSITENISSLNLSFAGGVVGIADIYTDVEANSMHHKTDSQVANISNLVVNGVIQVRASSSGGVLGYVGPQTNVRDVTLEIDGNQASKIIAYNFFAGAVVGESYGNLDMLKAQHDAKTQKEIENNVSSYYKSPSQTHARGNIMLFDDTSDGNIISTYSPIGIGGLVGALYAGDVTHSYSKINVISQSTSYAGGLVGGILDITNPLHDRNKINFFEVYAFGDVKVNQTAGAGGIVGFINANRQISMSKVNAVNFYSLAYDEKAKTYYLPENIYQIYALTNTQTDVAFVDSLVNYNQATNTASLKAPQNRLPVIITTGNSEDMFSVSAVKFASGSGTTNQYVKQSFAFMIGNQPYNMVIDPYYNLEDDQKTATDQLTTQAITPYYDLASVTTNGIAMDTYFIQANWDTHYWVRYSTTNDLLPSLVTYTESMSYYIDVAEDLQKMVYHPYATFIVRGLNQPSTIIPVGDYIESTGITLNTFYGTLKGLDQSLNYGLDFQNKSSFIQSATGASFYNLTLTNLGSSQGAYTNLNQAFVDMATLSTFENILVSNSVASTEINKDNYNVGILTNKMLGGFISSINFANCKIQAVVQKTIDKNLLSKINIGMLSGQIETNSSAMLQISDVCVYQTGSDFKNNQTNNVVTLNLSGQELTATEISIGAVIGETSANLGLTYSSGRLTNGLNRHIGISTIPNGKPYTMEKAQTQQFNGTKISVFGGGVAQEFNGGLLIGKATSAKIGFMGTSLNQKLQVVGGIELGGDVKPQINSANLGGLIGKVETALTVQNTATTETKFLEVDVNITFDADNLKAGMLSGAVGSAEGLNGIETFGQINANANNAMLGGMLGQVNSSLSISNAISNTVIRSSAQEAYVGGMLGLFSSQNGKLEIGTASITTKSLADLSVSGQQVIVGGTVGGIETASNGPTATVKIKYVLSGGNISVGNIENSLFAGGILGSATTPKSKTSLKVEIASCLAYGDINVHYNLASENHAVQVGGILGSGSGATSLSGNTSLETVASKTSATLNGVNIGAIIGVENGTKQGENLNYYSHQVCLALETSQKIGATNLYYGRTDSSLDQTDAKTTLAIKDILEDYLPLMSSTEKLSGSKLNPIIVSSTNEYLSAQNVMESETSVLGKDYILITKPLSLNTDPANLVNVHIIGDGNQIITQKNLFKTINEKSFVTGMQIVPSIQSAVATDGAVGTLANINNGFVFATTVITTNISAHQHTSLSYTLHNDYVGGLIGKNNGVIMDCMTSINIKANGSGGSLVGYNSGVIISSYTVGTIINGYAFGIGSGNVYSSYTATKADKGVFGSDHNLDDCFYDIYATGVIDDNALLTDTNTFSVIDSIKNQKLLFSTNSSSVKFAFVANQNFGYPSFAGSAYQTLSYMQGINTGDGTAENPIMLSNIGKLQQLNYTDSNEMHYVLITDIALTADMKTVAETITESTDSFDATFQVANWKPIQAFKGTLSGKYGENAGECYAINNLSSSFKALDQWSIFSSLENASVSYLKLNFGAVEVDADVLSGLAISIDGTTLDNISLTATSFKTTSSDQIKLGGLVAFAKAGAVKNTISNITINLPSITTNTDISSASIGGLIAEMQSANLTSEISNVTYQSQIEITASSNGLTQIGGVIGVAKNVSLDKIALSNVTITSSGTGKSELGGIFGTSTNLTNAVTNLSANIITLTTNSTATENSLGGFSGHAETTEISGADTITLTSVVVNMKGTGKLMAGGAFGSAKASSITKFSPPLSVTNELTGQNHIGGVVGDANATIVSADEIILSSYSINLPAKDSISTNYIGGVIGNAHHGSTVTASTEKLVVNGKFTKYENEGKGTTYLGGVCGVSENSILTNISVEGINLEGTRIGGIAGKINGGTLTTINVENCTITAKFFETSGALVAYAGGVASEMFDAQIGGVVVSGGKITTETITEQKTTDGKIEIVLKKDFAGKNLTTYIGGFSGTFSGIVTAGCSSSPEIVLVTGGYAGGLFGKTSESNLDSGTSFDGITASGSVNASLAKSLIGSQVQIGGVAGNLVGKITNSKFAGGSVSSNAPAYVGGIAGYATATFENCVVSGAISESASYTTATSAPAYTAVGGLAGYAKNAIFKNNSVGYDNGMVTGATVSGTYASGGLVGIADNPTFNGVLNKDYEGTVMYSELNKNYATVKAGVKEASDDSILPNNAYAGGIVGLASGGKIQYCENNGEVQSGWQDTSSSKLTQRDMFYYDRTGDDENCPEKTLQKIQNKVTLFNSSATGTQNAYAGGIAGYASGFEIMDNLSNKANITSMAKVSLTVETADRFQGDVRYNYIGVDSYSHYAVETENAQSAGIAITEEEIGKNNTNSAGAEIKGGGVMEYNIFSTDQGYSALNADNVYKSYILGYSFTYAGQSKEDIENSFESLYKSNPAGTEAWIQSQDQIKLVASKDGINQYVKYGAEGYPKEGNVTENLNVVVTEFVPSDEKYQSNVLPTTLYFYSNFNADGTQYGAKIIAPQGVPTFTTTAGQIPAIFFHYDSANQVITGPYSYVRVQQKQIQVPNPNYDADKAENDKDYDEKEFFIRTINEYTHYEATISNNRIYWTDISPEYQSPEFFDYEETYNGYKRDWTESSSIKDTFGDYKTHFVGGECVFDSLDNIITQNYAYSLSNSHGDVFVQNKDFILSINEIQAFDLSVCYEVSDVTAIDFTNKEPYDEDLSSDSGMIGGTPKTWVESTVLTDERLEGVKVPLDSLGIDFEDIGRDIWFATWIDETNTRRYHVLHWKENGLAEKMALYLVFETALDSTIETLLVVDGGTYGNLRDGMSIRNGNINYVIYQYAP